MSSARDAVADALTRNRPPSGVWRTAAVVPQILAALGIPADATADDVRAAMLMWTHPTWRAGTYHSERFGYIAVEEEDEHGYAVGFTATGETRAAAVLALAAKLAAQEATDA